MTTRHLDVDVETAKAQLKAEFPGWSIIFTNRERWWANRRIERDETGRAVDYAVTSVDANTPEGLAEQIRAAGP